MSSYTALTKLLLCSAIFSTTAFATDYTFVSIPGSNDIQTDLISTFPLGIFNANNSLGTPFLIRSASSTCGVSGDAPCNFYDGFGFSGSGTAFSIFTSVDSPTDVYTLLNAYQPQEGQVLATIEFIGSAGADVVFPLIGGENIRDFYQGNFANDVTNGVAGVTSYTAFLCQDPTTCLGGGSTSDVETGNKGTYVIDEQDFHLGNAFAGQTLTEIIITDTFNGSDPILLGITAGTPSPANSVATVNGASFSASQTVAPNSIAALFGADLANGTVAAASSLGDPLGGTSVSITDSSGVSELVPLFFVSPLQVNAQIPPDLASGTATVQVTSGDGTVSQGNVIITPVAPGVFSINDAALAYSEQSINGQSEYSFTFQADPANPGQYIPAPIQLSPAIDTYLILYGTGIENAALGDVSVQIGDTISPALFAGSDGYAGEDQINVLLPLSLAGSGDNLVTVTAAGEQANSVHIFIQ